MKNTVLLDFDGTLMNTTEVIYRSWQHTFNAIEGKEHPAEEIYRSFGETLEFSMRRLFPNRDFRECIEIYRSYHRDNFGDLITVFPGMRELLQELKARRYKVGLVTSRLRATTGEGLQKYGLAPYIDSIVSCEDTTKHKPDPEPIMIALEKLDAKPEEAVMVGDTRFDMGCAANAGVASVMVDWTVSLTEEEKQQADFLIRKPEELLEILMK